MGQGVVITSLLTWNVMGRVRRVWKCLSFGLVTDRSKVYTSYLCVYFSSLLINKILNLSTSGQNLEVNKWLIRKKILSAADNQWVKTKSLPCENVLCPRFEIQLTTEDDVFPSGKLRDTQSDLVQACVWPAVGVSLEDHAGNTAGLHFFWEVAQIHRFRCTPTCKTKNIQDTYRCTFRCTHKHTHLRIGI